MLVENPGDFDENRLLEIVARLLGVSIESLAQIVTVLAKEFGQREFEADNALSKAQVPLDVNAAEKRGATTILMCGEKI
ncbi:hypothetical protein [Burkholderia cenocepacia]|uniref:hypothetical protein n=1 Tax=Burkholderia cenocepacia TaxID=95486 RepID=UPI002AB7CB2E|nr:hypothetical protein [Burkholderia cenocepacia]